MAAFIIDVNPQVEEITRCADEHLKALSGTALPLLVQALQEAISSDVLPPVNREASRVQGHAACAKRTSPTEAAHRNASDRL
jgi:hypothetical protein